MTRLRMIRSVSQIPDVLRKVINNTGFVVWFDTELFRNTELEY